MAATKCLQTVGQTITKDKDFHTETVSSSWPPYVVDIASLPYRLVSCEFEEGEERVYVDKNCWTSPPIQHLVHSLLNWLNDVFSPERIILTDLVEDLYDGLIIRKLLEQLSNVDFGYAPMPLATLNKEEQLIRLRHTMEKCAQVLGPARLWDPVKWTAESMRNKNVIVILQVTVALAIHYRVPLRHCPPDQCKIRAMLVRKHNCHLYGRHVEADLVPRVTQESRTGQSPTRHEQRDAFDTLFDHAPEKLDTVTKAILTFVNRYLNKLNVQIVDLKEQFRDGVNLILLIGLLEGYFVPLYDYYPQPTEYSQKVQNVTLAFRLLDDAGIPRPKCTPEDMVSGDVKCTLRTLFLLHNRYHRI